MEVSVRDIALGSLHDAESGDTGEFFEAGPRGLKPGIVVKGLRKVSRVSMAYCKTLLSLSMTHWMYHGTPLCHGYTLQVYFAGSTEIALDVPNHRKIQQSRKDVHNSWSECISRGSRNLFSFGNNCSVCIVPYISTLNMFLTVETLEQSINMSQTMAQSYHRCLALLSERCSNALLHH